MRTVQQKHVANLFYIVGLAYLLLIRVAQRRSLPKYALLFIIFRMLEEVSRY